MKTKKFKQNNNRGKKSTNTFGKVIKLNSESISRRITRPTTIYTNPTTNNYTFTSGSDVRFIAFSNILASTEFVNMATVYNQYKLKSLVITMIPIVFTSYSQPCAGTFLEVEPNITPANPTNLTVIESDTAKMFNITATVTEYCTWTLTGVSSAFNIWNDVANASSQLGQLSLGANITANGFSGGILPAFDVRLELLVMFTDPK
jgi:hypothetical protein